MKGPTVEMTTDEIRDIAVNAARVAGAEAAKEAVHATLTALGIDTNKMVEEQQVWAFARTMQQGTQRGVRALFTGILTALATLVVGWLWYLFVSKTPPHP